MTTYVDSVILIYYLGMAGPLQVRSAVRLHSLLQSGRGIAISDLVRLECLVGPLRARSTRIATIFEGFFARPDVRLVPITPPVFDRAAAIRAHFGYKTPDSLHLAAAIEAGCGRFLTNDGRLARSSGIPIEILP